MIENKNIERLFQEKFKDFEVSPPDFFWENIEEKLHPKEKKRRVIPFWFKTAGIAASFIAVVSVVLFNSNSEFLNLNSEKNNSVVNSETKKSDSNQYNKINTLNTNNLNQTKSNSSVLETDTNVNSVVNSTNSKSEINSKQNKNIYNTSFVSNSKKIKKQNTLKINSTYLISSSSEIVSNRNNKNKRQSTIQSTDFISSRSKTSNPEFLNNTTSKNIINNSVLTDINTSKNNTINSGLTNNTSNISKNNTEIILEKGIENSNQNTSEIVLTEALKIDTITLAAVTIEENPMEKLLREKETEKVVNEKEKWSKWAVNSFVSPVFFNSFANGSPLSDEFATNEKTFKNSTSFGVGVAYNLNKRLSVKTGINNLNLNYDTQDIAYYSTFEDQSKIANTNIERNANSKYLALKNEKNLSKSQSIESFAVQSNENSGNLNQKTQYIEVPVEMSYALLNKKFGVAIKGGMSTLFLTENVISINSNDGNMLIGKASNLNNVHFSSNVGLGLSYNILKKVQLNIEPTLKYLINTFNKNSESFKPYVVGVNTGISYKF